MRKNYNLAVQSASCICTTPYLVFILHKYLVLGHVQTQLPPEAAVSSYTRVLNLAPGQK